MIFVGWLVVGGGRCHADAITGGENQNQQAETYSAMHKTNDKGDASSTKRLVLGRNGASDVRGGSNRTGGMTSSHRLTEDTKDGGRGTLLSLRPVQAH